MPLDILVPRARCLPRPRLLRGPDPYVEIHYFAGAAPVATSAPVRRRTEPEWPGFRARVALAPDDAPPRTVGVVVRDAAMHNSILGRCYIRVAACITEGWYPLDIDLPSSNSRSSSPTNAQTSLASSPPPDPKAYAHPAAEVYVRIEWPEYCTFSAWKRSDVVGHLEYCGDGAESECRAVAAEPGRFFRCGELLVSVYVLGVPTTAKDPQLALELEDQRLRGDQMEEASPSPGSDHRFGDDELARCDGGLFRSVLSRNEYKKKRLENNRRDANYGSFAFALFQGTMPDYLKLRLRNRSGNPASDMFPISEQTIDLPTQMKGYENLSSTSVGPRTPGNIENSWISTQASSKSASDSNHHVLHIRATGPGDQTSKVIFDVTLSYTFWKPAAVCRVVTPRFRHLLANMDDIAPKFKELYPVASDLKYLFVGGLFTRHYPKYFDFNIAYLKDELGFSYVCSVPIHTERSVASNAKIIRDSVVDAANGTRSVVLIGHSKGATDVSSAVVRYPELANLLYGTISFQGPFGGTFLVDFVTRKELAAKALLGVIENLWGGEKNSFLDMGYAARLEDVLCGYDRGNASFDDVARPQEHVPHSSILCDNAVVADRVQVYASIPTIAFASSASFSVQKLRSLANAAGFATMAPAAQKILQHTGFFNDGLVIPADARVPFADLVYLTNMMHTEPALYFPGTQYPPGKLTACAIALICEKWNSRASR